MMETMQVIFWIGAGSVWLGVSIWVFADGRPVSELGKIAMETGGIVLVIWLLLVGSQATFARDDGRYAGSPLKPWFDSLKSGKGPCCSDADGTALTDTDWDSKDGHYRVRIEDKWWDVPDEAVITEPNRVGRTMVWPVYRRGPENLEIDIRCFMPGSMT